MANGQRRSGSGFRVSSATRSRRTGGSSTSRPASGSAIPIGGGATCGKDPRKVDPRGQALARQIALDAVCMGAAREATVWLAYRPGDLTPRWIEVVKVPDDAFSEASKLNFRQSASDACRENLKRAKKHRD